MTSDPPPGDRAHTSLAQSIVNLAGTPDHADDIDDQLIRIARLAAGTLTAASYASITAVRDDAFTTVAASSNLAVAIDESQYADLNGPCLEALRHGAPVAVSNIAATMHWPGFREAAVRMGLRAALSIPLFAGSGATVAVLNLFGHDPAAMELLSRHVRAVHAVDHPAAAVGDDPPLGPDGDELIAGLTGAFAVLSTIQQGVGTVMAGEQCSAETAYRILRDRAAATGERLVDVAAAARHAHHPSRDSTM